MKKKDTCIAFRDSVFRLTAHTFLLTKKSYVFLADMSSKLHIISLFTLQ
jgi:hypothetical protein